MSETGAAVDGDRKKAHQEAATELGKGIALGLVPFLGQAIDAYDTIESSIALYQAKKGEDKENAQFDLLLALVGWIPGPGDGVKKSLRLVNRDPQRYAPVLFDLLRFVLQECGIQASPETLLDEIFNAGKLKAMLGEIKKGVEDASAFKTLPQWMQDAVLNTLTQAGITMPVMVGIVQKRLTKWKKLQRNSSANESVHGKATQSPPGAKDNHVAQQGQSRPAHGHANTSINSTLATQSLTQLTNDITGISGEHIADYICADTFKWGIDWKGHDDGAQGAWTEGKPSKTKLGKLSKGGSPKAAHALYKLSDGANGVGIDAVWRTGGHNGGKPYAIVEAKASKNEDTPKFMRKVNNTRKPGIASTLGDNAVTDASELIEPLEGAAGASSPARNRRRGTAQSGAPQKSAEPAAPDNSPAPANRVREVLVQMSREWVIKNLKKAVEKAVRDDIELRGYSRHLFYSPRYHESGSPAAHMQAKLTNQPSSSHAHHDAYHYDENKVRKAVNKRKAALRKKHGNLPSLKEEK